MLTVLGHPGCRRSVKTDLLLRCVLAGALAGLIPGCAGQGGASLAREYKLDASVLRGAPFLHQVLVNAALLFVVLAVFLLIFYGMNRWMAKKHR